LVTVPIRDAATVMLVRDALDQSGVPAVEVCMLRRNLASEFVAGAYVFPGGSVDPGDRGPAAEALCRGRTDAEASAILGVDSGGLAFWVAALRECFEESGVMLAQRRDDSRPDHGDLLDTRDPDVAKRFAAYRLAVNEGRVGLLDVCQQEDLVLAADNVHYVSHWITPELAPKRYDTRFFITAAPPDQVASHDEGETIATIWVRPADALARHASGDIELLPPTIANLKSLRPHRSTAEVMAWAGQVTDVPTVLPIVLVEDGHVLVLRPGDSGYEEALADRQASAPELQEALAEAARAAWGPKTGTD
jgi:8-oxo-dGTP pyrophosphatase MutT (NUDIX family)